MSSKPALKAVQHAIARGKAALRDEVAVVETWGALAELLRIAMAVEKFLLEDPEVKKDD